MCFFYFFSFSRSSDWIPSFHSVFWFCVFNQQQTCWMQQSIWLVFEVNVGFKSNQFLNIWYIRIQTAHMCVCEYVHTISRINMVFSHSRCDYYRTFRKELHGFFFRNKRTTSHIYRCQDQNKIQFQIWMFCLVMRICLLPFYFNLSLFSLH